MLDQRSALRVCGVGPERARIAAERAMLADTQALISCGLAGGLDPTLQAGSIVLASDVIDAADRERRWTTHARWRETLHTRLADARIGPLVSSTAPISSVADKTRFYAEQGAVAVDMESAAIAAVAAHHGVPFVAVRIIVDPAHMALPRATANALDPSGKPRPASLALALLRHPMEVPALVRLARYNRRAEAALRAIAIALHNQWSPP